jgi:SSS family solute:Na+ symporter
VSLGLAGFGQGYPTGSFLWIVNNLYFQYYSLFIFVVSCAVMVGVSYLTPAPAVERLQNLTFTTVTADGRQQSRASWNRWDVVNSGVVLLLILLAYLYFTG